MAIRSIVRPGACYRFRVEPVTPEVLASQLDASTKDIRQLAGGEGRRAKKPLDRDSDAIVF